MKNYRLLNHKKPIKRLLLLIIIFILKKTHLKSTHVSNQLSDRSICSFKETEFKNLLSSGEFKGFFTYEEFWQFYEKSLIEFPSIVSEKKQIGKTFEDRLIHGFYIGKDLSPESQITSKNIMFISGLHHSREPLTINMIVFLMFRIFRDSGACSEEADEQKSIKWHLFFKHNALFIVPIVNIDSYIFMNENWQSDDEEDVLDIRKNRNIAKECTIYNGGVDLNRNYDFNWGMDNNGSSDDPCQQDYRGSAPFSEPETRAIRDYVQTHPTIVTAVNNHSYGNCWTYPYNFLYDDDNQLLEQKKPKFYTFYNEFVEEMKEKKIEAHYGNNSKTIDYVTNGEAGDWMLEKHNIIDLDVELGDLDSKSKSFYPPIDQIHSICEYNYQVYEAFFWKHNIDIVLHKVEKHKRKNRIIVVVFNSSISTLYNFNAQIYLLGPIKRKRQRLLNHSSKIDTNKTLQKDSGLSAENTISEEEYSIKYALENACQMESSDLIEMKDDQFQGTLKGRTYIKFQIDFESKTQMENLEYVQLDFKTENNPDDSFLIHLELQKFHLKKKITKIVNLIKSLPRPSRTLLDKKSDQKRILFKLI